MKFCQLFRMSTVVAVVILSSSNSCLWAEDPDVGTYRIKSAWLADKNGNRPEMYINTQQGLDATPSDKGWLSARWFLEQIDDEGVKKTFRLRNKTSRKSYLHVEEGNLACGEILIDWESAWWEFQAGPAPGTWRIRNKWRREHYIHVQNGRLEAGPIEKDWQSAVWILELANSSHRTKPRLP